MASSKNSRLGIILVLSQSEVKYLADRITYSIILHDLYEELKDIADAPHADSYDVEMTIIEAKHARLMLAEEPDLETELQKEHRSAIWSELHNALSVRS